MTRYLGFAAVLLVANSLFLAGCGSADNGTPGGDQSSGPDNSSAVEGGDSQTDLPTLPGTNSGETSVDAGAGVDAGFGPGGLNQDASAPPEKKSVLGALGKALYKGAAGAAKEE